MKKPIDCHACGIDGGGSAKKEDTPDLKISPDFIDSLKRGDPDAYYRLIEENITQLHNFLVSVMRNTEDAEDIAQDVFIYIWENRDSLSGIRKLNNYIFAIAKHQAFRRKKLNLRFSELTGEEPAKGEFSEAPDEVIETQESERIVSAIVENMPRIRRQVYDMSRNKGYSNEEISRKLKISPTTVRRHISLALKDIRDGLLGLFF